MPIAHVTGGECPDETFARQPFLHLDVVADVTGVVVIDEIAPQHWRERNGRDTDDNQRDDEA